MRFIATTKLGLESVTAFQLKKLDLNDVQNADANVSFSGGFEDMAWALLYLRTAERLLADFDWDKVPRADIRLPTGLF